MADNVTANAGSGGAVFATDDISGVHYPISKLAWGALDTATLVASGAGAVPIQDGGNTITVDGTVTANLAAGTNTNEVVGDAAHDAAAAGNPLLIGGYASAAAPADVSADADVVRAWLLRNGATATVLTAAGALIGGDATNGIDVDVTRLPALVAGTANIGDVDVASIAAGDNNIGNVDVLTVIPGTGATSLGKAEDAAHTTADTGVYALAVRDDSPAAHSGTDGDYESIHVNAEGGVWTTPTPSASGGLSIFRSLDLDETEEEVKATAGSVYAMWVTNTATATRFLKFYNATAANVTVGTTTPVITIGIPGNSTDDIAGNFGPGEMGIGFSTAITVAVTTAAADNDTGAPGAGDVIVNIFYK